MVQRPLAIVAQLARALENPCNVALNSQCGAVVRRSRVQVPPIAQQKNIEILKHRQAGY